VIPPEDVIELLKELINIPSPLYEEEEIANYVGNWLERSGLEVEYQYVEKRRPNVIAWIKGKHDDVRIMLVGHLDTFFIEGERIEAKVADGSVWGRGAVDMKGAIAAMMVAFSRVSKLNLKYTATLGLVVDEEGKGKGSELLATKIRSEKAIVGEPTDLSISPSQAGLLELEIMVKGVRGHVTLPEHGVNAYVEAMKVLNYIKEVHMFRDKGPLPYMRPTLVVSRVECGEDPWSIPKHCRIHIVMSLLPWQDPDVIFDEVSRASMNLVSNSCELLMSMVDDDLGYWLVNWEKQFSTLIDVIKLLTGKVRISYMRSWCDANNLYHKGGIPTVVFGPGDLKLAHSDYERIGIRDVLLASKIYYEVLVKELEAK